MSVFTAAEGAYRLQARLSFATVPEIRPEGLALIQAAGAQLCIDLSGVSAADSAGLALLIDWLGEAASSGKQLRYSRLPPALLALAKLSEVASLLEGQVVGKPV